MTRRHTENGAAAIEFAILLIPLLVIVTGITEIGRAMYYYNTLTKSVRDAARLLSTQAPTDPDYATLKATAACLAVYGNSGCSGSALVPGLSETMFSVCDAASCPETHSAVATGTGAINLVTVTIGATGNEYTFTSLAAFAPALFGVPSIQFSAISVTMRQII
jgi:Flp pilus assembly protein TadG